MARTHIEGTLRHWRRGVKKNGSKQATVLGWGRKCRKQLRTRAVQLVHSTLSLSVKTRNYATVVNCGQRVFWYCLSNMSGYHLNILVKLLSQNIKLTDVTFCKVPAVLPSPNANTTSHSLRQALPSPVQNRLLIPLPAGISLPG